MLYEEMFELKSILSLHALENDITEIKSLNILIDTDKRFQGIFTLEVIAYLMGMTRERVRQIEGSAMLKLKHPKYQRGLKQYVEMDAPQQEFGINPSLESTVVDTNDYEVIQENQYN